MRPGLLTLILFCRTGEPHKDPFLLRRGPYGRMGTGQFCQYEEACKGRVDMKQKRITAPKTWYVYTYAFPDGSIFYVGKGNQGQIDEHEREAQEGCDCKKCQTIREIWASGHPVQKRIVYETLLEAEALEHEKTLIQLHAGPHLTNQRLPPRQRLLDTASTLFYQQGIQAIGVDTIVEQSGVGKATLYRHFPTKDDLIAAYLEQEDRLWWAWFEEVVTPYEGKPKEQLLAFFEACTRRLTEPGFRGCAFLNALAEIPEADHPAHRNAVGHERALRERFADLSRQAGARDPEQLADQLLLISNGALASAPLFGETSPAVQLNTIAAHLINLQCESQEARP
jgi:AcrR family transcriptional regulator